MPNKNDQTQNNHEFYEKLLQSLPGNVYWKDRNGIYLGCNQMQAHNLGYSSPNEIIGKSDFDLLSRNEAEEVRKNDLHVMDSGVRQILEENSLVESGKILVFLSQKMPMFSENGEVIGVMGISFDITDRKLKEKAEQLEQQRTKLALDEVIENMPGHVYWKDIDGIYLGCNKQQAESLGLESSNEMIGKTDYDLSPVQHADAFRNADLNIMNSKQECTIEEKAILKDGSEHTFLTKKIPLVEQDGDKIVGILGISFDITDHKKAELLEREKAIIQQRNRELQNQVKLLQRQAGTIAHELRTPLGSISNSAAFLELLCDEIKDHQIRNDIEKAYKLINTETRLANNFINIIMNNLRDLKQVSLTDLSITQCINQALNRYPFEPDQGNIIELPSIHDFSFKGESEIMVHILFNLIKNALYFIKAAGKGKIVIWTEQDTNNNYLHFKDTGKGMAIQKTKQIFKEFYSDTGVGVGIGLYFCKRAMQTFGGDITCDAQEGEYTLFSMRFPRIETGKEANSEEK